MAATPRFAFGRNWLRFLATIDQRSIAGAVKGLRRLLGDQLRGRTFLDLGCGCGLASLAALHLGAREIQGVDCDADSVLASNQLRARTGAPVAWHAAQLGDVLDPVFMASVPRADVVHSFGFLHHTGDLRRAVALAADRVRPGGRLVLGIYHKKRWLSALYARAKRAYCTSGWLGRAALMTLHLLATGLWGLLRGKNLVAEIRGYRSRRGMDWWRDQTDWLGGHPFECATPAEVEALVAPLGFELEHRFTCSSVAAVNEYVFRSTREPVVLLPRNAPVVNLAAARARAEQDAAEHDAAEPR